MFGDLMGMMGKLQETQQRIAETKARMDTVMVDEKSSDGLLSVSMTANRTLKAVTIDDALLADKEQLEDYILLVINKAIERATDINDAETAAAAKVGMPDLPDMDGLFK